MTSIALQMPIERRVALALGRQALPFCASLDSTIIALSRPKIITAIHREEGEEATWTKMKSNEVTSARRKSKRRTVWPASQKHGIPHHILAHFVIEHQNCKFIKQTQFLKLHTFVLAARVSKGPIWQTAVLSITPAAEARICGARFPILLLSSFSWAH